MAETQIKYYRFQGLLLQQGWIRPAYVGVDADGLIQFLSDQPFAHEFAVEAINGIALPGFVNAHSHAFQFAMAGMAEKHIPGSTDDFWTWREAMYECALTMDPDHIEAVAAMLYSQMLRSGVTHVCEFHYLHHDLNGKRYANLAETGERLVSAAQTAGIRITLIPVFYQKGGFGMQPHIKQCRFILDETEDYLELLDSSASAVKGYSGATLGFGVHSLRAVNARDVFRTIENGPRDLPFHIHAAEQLKEVEECIDYLGQRPVEWLLNNLPLQERFNLVHCTHMNDDEIVRLAKSRANVVLCPSTEGNLGDGVFRLKDFSSAYGNWCIGSDSQINLNPMEDLRWLDYSQRLTSHKRNTFDDGATEFLSKAIICGKKAAGETMLNFFEIGKAFDAVIFNSNSPLIRQNNGDHLLPALVYTTDTSCILGSMVNGEWNVKNNVVKNGEIIQRNYFEALKELSE
jgi:formimidoylglutamate deiminase